MKFIKYILLLIIVLIILGFNRCGGKIEEQPELDKLNNLAKVGIVSVDFDKVNKKYIDREEIFIKDEDIIAEIKDIIKKGKIDNSIKLDRLPSEYKLNLYCGITTLRASYWIKCTKYNLNIGGISGEITVDGKKMDKIIMKAAEEENRKSFYEKNKDYSRGGNI